MNEATTTGKTRASSNERYQTPNTPNEFDSKSTLLSKQSK